MNASTLLACLALSLFALASTASDSPPGEDGLLDDLQFAGRLVVEDAAAVVSSPFRMNRESALRFAGVMAIGGVLFAFDEDINEMVQRNEDAEPLDTVRRVGDAVENVGLMGKTWPYYLALTAAGYAAGNSKLTRIGGEILLAQYTSGGLRNLGKLLVGRHRPHEGEGAYVFEINGGTSLPSGHAASAFAAFTVLAHHVDRPWATVGSYTLATAIAYQRLSSESHWASDVWLGAISGYAAAKLITRRHDRILEERSGSNLGLMLGPDAQPAVAWSTAF